MHKKILALLCATAMTASLAACGQEPANKEVESTPSTSTETQQASEEVVEPKEPVEITLWYGNGVGVQEYTDEVEAKINEMLAETEGYEHITLRLHPSKDYATDIALAQSTGEQLDIYSTVSLDYVTEAKNGAIIPLDDLLAANPEITADLPEWFLDYGKVDGQIYQIPNYQQLANAYFWVTPTEWFEASGFSYDEIQQASYDRNADKLSAFLEDYVVSVRKTTGKDTKYNFPSLYSYSTTWDYYNNQVYHFGNGEKLFYNAETGKVECTYLSEATQNAWRKEAEWYVEGINYPDHITAKITNNVLGDIMQDTSYVMNRVEGYGTVEMVEAVNEANYGYDCTVWALQDKYYIPMTNAAKGVAISATCEHPEDAAMVLALLFNSKYADIYNTLAWGLEGTHYEDNGDGTIKTLEFSGSQGGADTTYCYHKWKGGNTFNLKQNQSMTLEQMNYVLDEVNEGANNIKSPLLGMTLDTEPIANELAQIKSIHKEYYNSFWCGVYGKDIDKYIDEFIAKLEAAGLQKVLDEVNAQAAAYLAK